MMFLSNIWLEKTHPTSNVTQDFKEQILDDVKDRREAYFHRGEMENKTLTMVT